VGSLDEQLVFVLLRDVDSVDDDRQWRRERAAQMLRRALEMEPGNERLRARLEELANASASGSPLPAGGHPDPPRSRRHLW